MSKEKSNQHSLSKLADSLVSGTKNLLREAKTEEDLSVDSQHI